MSGPERPTIIRVLHVDDESDQRLMAKMFLEKFDPGLQVESVSSGEEVLRLLKEQSFDCVVSDYQMPAMDGLQLCTLVNERSRHPFILYTGRGSEEVAERAYAYGAAAYVRKEMDPSHYLVLANRVRTAVQRRRAEEAERESEERYRSLVQNSRDGVMVFTGEELVYANQQAAALHGYGSVEELMEISPSAILHPDDREYVEGRSLARQRGEDVSPLTEYRLVQPDGAMRYVQSSSSLIQYDGKSSTLAFIRDITERKQMVEEELIRLSNAVKMSMDSIVISDLDGKIIYINEVTLKMYGAEGRGELIGKNYFELIAPEDREKALAGMKEVMEEGYITGQEYHIVIKDGSRIPVRARALVCVEEECRVELEEEFEVFFGQSHSLFTDPRVRGVHMFLMTDRMVLAFSIESMDAHGAS